MAFGIGGGFGGMPGSGNFNVGAEPNHLQGLDPNLLLQLLQGLGGLKGLGGAASGAAGAGQTLGGLAPGAQQNATTGGGGKAGGLGKGQGLALGLLALPALAGLFQAGRGGARSTKALGASFDRRRNQAASRATQRFQSQGIRGPAAAAGVEQALLPLDLEQSAMEEQLRGQQQQQQLQQLLQGLLGIGSLGAGIATGNPAFALGGGSSLASLFGGGQG